MDNTDDNIRKYVDTKLKKINRVLKDPDGYNSGIASNDRVDEMNERVSELEAIYLCHLLSIPILPHM